MWKRGGVVVLALIGCSGRRAASTRSDAALPDASPPSPPVIDRSAVVACVVSYSCGMSHPGLGSWSRSTAVDLGACQKTSAHSSSAYSDGSESAVPTGPQKSVAVVAIDAAAAAGPVPVKLEAATCERIAMAAAAVTQAEAKRHEPAPMDTAACTVALLCDQGQRVVYSIQRQTTEIADHVSALVTELQGI